MDSVPTANFICMHVLQDAVAMLYKKDAWERILYLPPADNAMNIVDSLLMTRMYSSWADAFFRAAQLTKKMWVAVPPRYSVFSRSHSVVGLAFSFDREI